MRSIARAAAAPVVERGRAGRKEPCNGAQPSNQIPNGRVTQSQTFADKKQPIPSFVRRADGRERTLTSAVGEDVVFLCRPYNCVNVRKNVAVRLLLFLASLYTYCTKNKWIVSSLLPLLPQATVYCQRHPGFKKCAPPPSPGLRQTVRLSPCQRMAVVGSQRALDHTFTLALPPEIVIVVMS